MAAEPIPVQVCWAMPEEAHFRDLLVAPGTTVEQALLQSGIDPAAQPVGIHGKKRALDTVLRAHDRIELYRPLIADPKDSRRRRAEKKAPT